MPNTANYSTTKPSNQKINHFSPTDMVVNTDALFSGNLQAITPASSDNSTSVATTAFVKTALSSVGGGSSLVIFTAQCDYGNYYSWPNIIPFLKSDWSASSNYTNIGNFTYDTSITYIRVPSSGIYEINLNLQATVSGSYSLAGILINNNSPDYPLVVSRSR